MMFEGANFPLMSHWVFGKYADGVPHAPVSIEPELLFCTSDGTLLAPRGQNQIWMNVDVRSIAYLHTGWEKESVQLPSCGEKRERGAGQLHAPSAAVVVERGSIVVGVSGMYATTCVAIFIRVAVQSGGVAIGHKGKKYRVSENYNNMVS